MKKVYFLSFLSPLLIMIIGAYLLEIQPFGQLTALSTDSYHQYLSYLNYYYEVFKGNKSLFYAWEAGLGGNFYSVFAYYLASPVTLLILLFDKENIITAITVMMWAKIAFVGLAMSIYIKRKYKQIKQGEIVFFSTFYALMGYSLAHYSNYMWMDGVIYLPLLILSVDALIERHKKAPFILFLSILFISNFYISYMVGIFIFLYFLFKIQNTKMDWKNHVKSFFISVFTAMLTASVIIIPVIFNLMGVDKGIDEFLFLINPIEIFESLLPGHVFNINKGGVYLYIGLFALMLAPLFIINPNIRKEDKIKWSTLGTVVLVSLCIPYMDYIWNGFDIPSGYYGRYSFLFSFVLLNMTLLTYSHIKSVKNKSILVTFLSMTLLVMSYDLFVSSTKEVFIFHLFFIALVSLIVKFKRNDMYKKAIIYMSLLMVLELTFHVYVYHKKHWIIDGDTDIKYYNEVKSFEKTLRSVEGLVKDENARINVTTQLITNDEFLLLRGGIAYFNSFVNESTLEALENIGISTTKAKYNSNGLTPFSRSILGEKYILSKEEEDVSNYKKIKTVNGHHVYENKYTLPLGIHIPNGVEKLTMEINPFSNINKIASAMVGEELELYTAIEPDDYTYKNAKYNKKYEVLERKNKEKPISIYYTFNNVKKESIFYQLQRDTHWKTTVYHNNKEEEKTTDSLNNGIRKTPSLKNIEFKITQEYDFVKPLENFFYIENKVEMERFYSLVKEKGAAEITKERNALTAKGSSDKKGLLFLQIPQDNGWNITVNDKTVNSVTLFNGFVGIPLEKGDYEIQMTYIPRGLKLGIVLSVIGILLICVIYRKEKGKGGA